MKKLFLFILSLTFFFQPLFSQVGTAVKVPMWVPGRLFPMWVQLPENYDPNTKYPLIMFIHGLGEAAGVSETDAGFINGDYLNKIYNNSQSLPYFRERTWNGKAWNPVTNDSTSFIIVNPQSGGWMSVGNLQYFLKYTVQNYSVDTNRIYLTGFSNGGRSSYRYARADANAANSPSTSLAMGAQPWKPAAVAPMSIADDFPTVAEAERIVDDSIHVWTFGSPVGDTYGAVSDSLAVKINRYKPGWARWTQYSGGHCCWGQFYTPSFEDNVDGTDMNLYSWFLLYSRDPNYYNQGEPGVAPAPIVNAGADKNVGSDNTTLVGDAQAGDETVTITGYQWTKVSGGTATIVNPNDISTTISGLENGTYTFRLTVTQSDNQTNYDDIRVTVNISPVGDCGCTVTYTPEYGGNGNVNITNQSNQIKAGDTVCITAGRYYRINFENIHGTQENPIVIKNCGGEVVISSDYYGGMFRVVNSTHVHVDGAGDPNYFYGFRTEAYQGDSTSSAFAFGGKISDFEINNVWGDWCRGWGMQLKTNPVNYDRETWHPYGSINNISIHDTKISNTNAEGYYIGYTNTGSVVKTLDELGNPVDTTIDAPSINGLQFYRNIADRNGWDGIQISAAENIVCYDNIVTNYGLTGLGAQSTGLQFGGRTWGLCYNNIVETGTNMGMFFMGFNEDHPPTLVYNNIIANAGLDGISVADRPGGGKYLGQKIYFFNNTIISPARNGASLNNAYSTVDGGNMFKNNLIAGKGSGYFISINNAMKPLYDTTGNILITNLSDAKFQDGSYKLKPESPAYNIVGYDASAYFNYDYDYVSRNGQFGIGAYITYPPSGQSDPPVAHVSIVEDTVNYPEIELWGVDTAASGLSIIKREWTKVSGGFANIVSPSDDTTLVNGLSNGEYVFRFTVTQSDNQTASKEIKIVVRDLSVQGIIIRQFFIIKGKQKIQ